MSQQWRILVVEGEEMLNRSIVQALSMDGYSVQGVPTGGEAIRLLWEHELHLVISDRTLPDSDGFDLLQWIRTYRPQTRMMMLAAPGMPGARTQALENGAVAYLEKPVDPRLLKVEVRRLLQQSGFTANLASFDLLDVIQIINMSRKSIAMLVHTGLEEQGLLGFQEGELIWADYGVLRGEEAFFALAAHKNGMVTQQPWNGVTTPNVTQPLSRLILQALQYRSKYALSQQFSGEQEAVSVAALGGDEKIDFAIDAALSEAEDDRPFVFVAEEAGPPPPATREPKEWWQESAKIRTVEGTKSEPKATESQVGQLPFPGNERSGLQKVVGGASITPSTVRKTALGQRSDLPSWLIDQPTQFELPALRPSSLSNSDRVPVPHVNKPSPAEWQPPTPPRASSPRIPPNTPVTSAVQPPRARLAGPAETAVPAAPAASVDQPAATLQSLMASRKTDDLPPSVPQPARQANRSANAHGISAVAHNYYALVATLKTLGYSLAGFVAAAVVGMDGLPIAQVAVDDRDIAEVCGDFSIVLRRAMHMLETGLWGQFEDMIITSATHYILLRLLGYEQGAFQVVITTRETDPTASLEMMASVEGALIAGL